MVADHDAQNAFDERYALALIRARIDEKRLFEARFLCRRLGEGLSAASKSALARELDESLTQVEQLRQQAKALMAQGEHGQAGQLYSRIEALAVDVPGVAEERQALAGAEALAARLHTPPAVETSPHPDPLIEANGEAEVHTEVVAKALPPNAKTVQTVPGLFSRRHVRLLLGVGGLVLGVLIVLLLVWGRNGQQPPPVAKTTTIVIEPLRPESTATPSPAPSPSVQQPVVSTSAIEQSAPAAPPPPASPAAALQLGSLRIEQSGK